MQELSACNSKLQENLNKNTFDLTMIKYIQQYRNKTPSEDKLVYGKDYDYIFESMYSEYKLDVKELKNIQGRCLNATPEELVSLVSDFNMLYPESHATVDNVRSIRIPDTVLKKVHFVQSPKGPDGLPSVHYSLKEKLLSDFRANRSKVKKLMAQAALAHDAVAETRYNAKQLAIKVVCNSEYGASNNSTFAHYDPDVAGAVTFASRSLIFFLTTNLEHNMLVVDEDFIKSNSKQIEVLAEIGCLNVECFNESVFEELKENKFQESTYNGSVKHRTLTEIVSPTIQPTDTFYSYLLRNRRHILRRVFDDDYTLLIPDLYVILIEPSTVCYQDTDSNYYKNEYIADFYTQTRDSGAEVNRMDNMKNNSEMGSAETDNSGDNTVNTSNIYTSSDSSLDPMHSCSPERLDAGMHAMLAHNELLAEFVKQSICRRPYGLGFEGAFIVCRYLNRKKKYYGIKWGDDEELSLGYKLPADAYTDGVLKKDYSTYWKPKTTVLPRPNGDYIALDNQKLLYDNVNYLDYIKSQNVKCTGVDLARRDQYKFINYFHMYILQNDLRFMKYLGNNCWDMYKIDEPMKNVIDNVIETFRSIMNTNERIVNFRTTELPIIDFNIEHFSKNAAYRLNKQNAVTTIVERLKSEGKDRFIPPLGERILYVVIMDDETTQRRLTGMSANKTNSDRSYLVHELKEEMMQKYPYDWCKKECLENGLQWEDEEEFMQDEGAGNINSNTDTSSTDTTNDISNTDTTSDTVSDNTSSAPPLTYSRWINAKIISLLDMRYYLECLAKSTALYIVGDEYPDIIEAIDAGTISKDVAGAQISKLQAEISKKYVSKYYSINKNSVKALRENEKSLVSFSKNASKTGIEFINKAYAKLLADKGGFNKITKYFIKNDAETNIEKFSKVKDQLENLYARVSVDSFVDVSSFDAKTQKLYDRFDNNKEKLLEEIVKCTKRLEIYRIILSTINELIEEKNNSSSNVSENDLPEMDPEDTEEEDESDVDEH